MILGVQVSKRTTGSMRRVKKGSMMEVPFRANGGWKNRGGMATTQTRAAGICCNI